MNFKETICIHSVVFYKSSPKCSTMLCPSLVVGLSDCTHPPTSKTPHLPLLSTCGTSSVTVQTLPVARGSASLPISFLTLSYLTVFPEVPQIHLGCSVLHLPRASQGLFPYSLHACTAGLLQAITVTPCSLAHYSEASAFLPCYLLYESTHSSSVSLSL